MHRGESLGIYQFGGRAGWPEVMVILGIKVELAV